MRDIEVWSKRKRCSRGQDCVKQIIHGFGCVGPGARFIPDNQEMCDDCVLAIFNLGAPEYSECCGSTFSEGEVLKALRQYLSDRNVNN